MNKNTKEETFYEEKFYLFLDCPTPTDKATTVKQDGASTTVKPVEGTTRAATTQVNNQDNCPPADFCSNRADGTYGFEDDETRFFTCRDNKPDGGCQSCSLTLVFKEACGLCLRKENSKSIVVWF